MTAKPWPDAATLQDRLLRLEAAAMSGKVVTESEMASLPRSAFESSPFLLRLRCGSLLMNGRHDEAAEMISKTVRRYASLADTRGMLSMLAQWSLLHYRLGLPPDSGPPLGWLAEEWRRSREACDGFVPWALALSEPECRRSPRRADGRFDEAASKFSADGEWAHAAWVVLDRMVYDCETFLGDAKWRSWTDCLNRWSAIDPVCRSAGALIEAMTDKEWNGRIERNGDMPIRYEVMARAERWLRRAMDLPPDAFRLEWKETGKPLLDELKALAGDVEIGLLAACVEWARAMRTGQKERASVSLDNAARTEQWVASPRSARLLEWMRSIRPSAYEQVKTDDVWKVELLGSLTISRSDGKLISPDWKRQKSRELFVYLLLQPRYRAQRDQVIEHLFGEGDPEKLGNQLYVALHDCRKSLGCAGWSNAIYVKNGMIGIRENEVGVVDAERFAALCRVGQQLWDVERDEAVRMFKEAASLYGITAPELKQSDWLDGHRFRLLNLWSAMIGRLSEDSVSRGRFAEAERLLTEWIQTCPEREEAYQAIIALLTSRDRLAEAHQWYAKLERICREQLEAVPTEETRNLLRRTQ